MPAVDARAVIEIVATVASVAAGVASLKSDIKWIKALLKEHMRQDETNFSDVRTQLNQLREMK